MAFTGRLLAIANLVRMYMQEADYNDTISDNQLLLMVNLCTDDLVKTGVFKKTSTINIVSGIASYSYPSDATEILDVFWTSTGERLLRIDNERMYRYLLSTEGTANSAWGRYITRSLIYIWPTPSESVTAGITVYHKYTPTAMTGTTELGCTPPTPAGFDRVYVAYCIREIAALKRGLTKQDNLYARWDVEYRKEAALTLRQGMSL